MQEVVTSLKEEQKVRMEKHSHNKKDDLRKKMDEVRFL
jgi:hypothetical protein